MKSASDPIYESLKDRIVDGQVSADSPLRQDAIANEFGVSKIPVREALFQLEKDGLVKFLPNKGAFVCGLSAAEALDLMDIRLALECRALELAIPNMIATDFDGMQALLEEYQATLDMSAWSDLNRRFHFMLYEPSGNQQLLSMINDVQRRLGRYLRLVVTEASGRERPMAEHLEILKFCEQRKTDEALRCLRDHIETTKKELAAFMRRGI